MGYHLEGNSKMSETNPGDAEEAERLLSMIYYTPTRNIFGNGKLVLENSEILGNNLS